MVVVCVYDDGLVPCEFFFVFADRTPGVVLAIPGSFYLWIRALAILSLVRSHLQLVDANYIHIHPSYFFASIFKPEYIQALVNIETILFGV